MMRFFCAFGLCVIAACSTATQSGLKQPNELPATFKSPDPGLQPNDVLTIKVFGEEELSGKYQVSERGTIDFPLVGRVEVLGLTPPAVGDILRDRLSDGFLKQPSVSVFVEDYGAKKKVFVWGQVQRSGTFNYAHNMNLIEAITLAGGTTPLADSVFQITRMVDGERKVISVAADRGAQYALRPGDVVYVPERVF